MPRVAFVTLLLVLTAPLAALAQTDSKSSSTIETVLHLLDYLSVEYPQFVQDGKVVNPGEYAEQAEFAQQIEQAIRHLPAGPKANTFAARAASLTTLIKAKADGSKVASLARELQRDLISAYNVPVAPRKLPDLRTAGALYAAHCAACHGLEGDGAGPQAATLNPHPTNFRDRARQQQRSVYALYSTVTQGVDGTAMAPFAILSEEDRWKLAFYVSRFLSTDEQRARGAVVWARGDQREVFRDAAALVTMTPAGAGEHGSDVESVLAYLRANPAEVAPETQSPIAISIDALAQSLEAYRRGNTTQAYQLAVMAYLEGFELTEASLDNHDHDLRTRTEAAMMAYRNALKEQRPVDEVERAYGAAVELLHAADVRLSAPMGSPTASFVSSLIIILREGLEAILVLAAMAAFLVRTGRRDGLPWLHGGGSLPCCSEG